MVGVSEYAAVSTLIQPIRAASVLRTQLRVSTRLCNWLQRIQGGGSEESIQIPWGGASLVSMLIWVFTQMMRRQNFDARPGMDCFVCSLLGVMLNLTPGVSGPDNNRTIFPTSLCGPKFSGPENDQIVWSLSGPGRCLVLLHRASKMLTSPSQCGNL